MSLIMTELLSDWQNTIYILDKYIANIQMAKSVLH